jgi:outer membrane receptor protein involved in Fe transport
MKYLMSAVFALITTCAFSQKGTLRGTIIDDATGETIVGAYVIIPDAATATGAMTDLDGQFTLKLDPGTYKVQVSYISYQTLTITDVVIKADDVTVFDNIRLKESTIEFKEVVITAKAVRTSEVALLSLKKNSVNMMDGISAAQIQKVGDATAVEAAKRVTGVSIEDGKYIYVRGLGDRYTKTTLNNIDIPGLDPDRNSLQMDIFPTNLIDNIIVSKNFMADMPADFTGGLLNVETKDFPEKKIFSVSAGLGYNPDMHFNENYLSYEGGSTDFLGFDDGTRALPRYAASANIPTPISGATSDQVNSFVSSFNPQLGANRTRSLMDYSANISVGNQIGLGKKGEENSEASPKLGYIFSASYRTDYKYYDDVTYAEYQRFIDPDLKEMRYATIQTGQLGEKNVLIGLLGGLAYKTQYSKYRLTAMHLQSGESRAGQFAIDNDGAAVGQSGYLATSDNLEYNQRALTNVLLNGTHLFKESKWEMDWRLSPTISSSEDPDIRRTAFTQTAVDTSFIAGAGGNPTRIWRSLSEISMAAKIDFTKNYTFKEKDAKLKFGASHLYKLRDYEILFFDIQFFGSQTWTSTDPNQVLNPENIFPNTPNRLYYQSGNNNPNPNQYSSNVNNTGFYASNELNLTSRLKTIIGARGEYFVQRHTGRNQAFASGDSINGRNLVNEKVLDALDIFPSVNFIYSLSEEQNLRFSYTKTIARPSFKELSFAQIIDPITNRIFNGTLFEYSDWDGNLVETRIDNLDLRWEMFMPRGQILSLSAFYKRFDNPIELVRIPEQQTSTEFQPRNVGDGMLIGVELEARKNLEFISASLKNLSLSGNVTIVESQIEMSDREFNARKEYEKTGQTITNIRAMAGQSPVVINGGISYAADSLGLDVGLFYNVKGSTLYIVGAGLFPDIYYEPFHSLNFSLNKKLGKEGRSVIDFRIANILGDRIETFYQSFEAQEQIFSSIYPGRSFSIGFSHKF